MVHNPDYFNSASIPRAIRKLFDPEINVQDQDHNGNTILHRYVIKNKNYPGVLDGLINRGTDLEIKNNYQRTAFLQAVIQFRKTMINTFIERRADVHTTDDDGHNALHFLTFAGIHVDLPSKLRFILPLFEKLIETGVDVNFRNRAGETPLMLAASLNNVSIVKILLEHGADVSIENTSSKTCLHIASIPATQNARVWVEMNSGIITELIRKGAPINSFDNEGRTPLSCILQSGHRNRFFFAEAFLIVACLVNWRNRIPFRLLRGRTLGWLPGQRALSSLVEKCYVEIAIMARCRLSQGGYTLCQFALAGVSTAERRTADQESNAAFRILLRQNFDLYNKFILLSCGVKFMRRKFSELYISITIEEREIFLNADLNKIIANCLGIQDLFAAFQASEITAQLKKCPLTF